MHTLNRLKHPKTRSLNTLTEASRSTITNIIGRRLRSKTFSSKCSELCYFLKLLKVQINLEEREWEKSFDMEFPLFPTL